MRNEIAMPKYENAVSAITVANTVLFRAPETSRGTSRNSNGSIGTK